MVFLVQCTLIFTLALTPIIIPIFGFGYEQSKVFVFNLLVLCASVIFFMLLYDKRKSFNLTNIFKVSLLFLGILFISSLLGAYPLASLIGRYPYFQGFILYFFLFLFYLLVSKTKIPLLTWSIAITASASIVAILAIKDWILANIFHQEIINFSGRVVSSFGQPNFYAGFLLFSLPFVYLIDQKLEGKQKIWTHLTIFILGAAIVVSQSRVAILILVGLSLVFLIKLLGRQLNILLIAFLVIAFYLYSHQYLVEIFKKEIIQPQSLEWLQKNSPEKRIYIWPRVGQLILERPILGYGLENIEEVFTEGETATKFKSVRDLSINRAHNYSLDLIFSIGLVGFLSWCLLIYFAFKKSKNQILTISLVVYLIWAQLQVQSIVHLMYFWLLIGLIDQNHS